jgi:hypothetical protein
MDHEATADAGLAAHNRMLSQPTRTEKIGRTPLISRGRRMNSTSRSESSAALPRELRLTARDE